VGTIRNSKIEFKFCANFFETEKKLKDFKLSLFLGTPKRVRRVNLLDDGGRAEGGMRTEGWSRREQEGRR
jgi:hypothetical protein